MAQNDKNKIDEWSLGLAGIVPMKPDIFPDSPRHAKSKLPKKKNVIPGKGRLDERLLGFAGITTLKPVIFPDSRLAAFKDLNEREDAPEDASEAKQHGQDLNRKVGYLDEEIKSLQELFGYLQRIVDHLRNGKAAAAAEIYDDLTSAQRKRMDDDNYISPNIKTFLHNHRP